MRLPAEPPPQCSNTQGFFGCWSCKPYSPVKIPASQTAFVSSEAACCLPLLGLCTCRSCSLGHSPGVFLFQHQLSSLCLQGTFSDHSHLSGPPPGQHCSVCVCVCVCVCVSSTCESLYGNRRQETKGQHGGLSLCRRAGAAVRPRCGTGLPSPLHLPPGVRRACRSFRRLDRCEHQIGPQQTKFHVFNSAQDPLFHCNCTRR